jgi:uncharacterized protein YjdB
MTATTYTEQRDYLKHAKKESECGCGSKNEGCGCEKKCDDCGCCPPGLVAIYDDQGHHLACLTPNDAELYKKNIVICQDGYVKLFKDSTGEFLGCVSEDSYENLNNNVNNASIDPEGLSIIPTTNTMSVGGTLQLYPRFTPTNTTDQGVTWSSSNAAAASVDASGLVEALGAGTTTITATSDADGAIVATRTITIS